MSNLWVTFSTDSSGSFTELSGNIIYNINNLYNFNGNLVDTTSNFIIYELSNNPIQRGVSLQATNWKQLNLNTILNPFQGYWLGGINTTFPTVDIRLYTYSLTETVGYTSVVSFYDVFSYGIDSDTNRIINVLNIPSIDDLTNYTFTSSADEAIINILEIYSTETQSNGTTYNFTISVTGVPPGTYSYYAPLTDPTASIYTLTFSRRT
tara:strand:- start:5903 stop:6526 length:624 start_codon:yes stop_codon:yes gene_type:complete